MNKIMIKETVKIVKKNGIYHLLDNNSKVRKFKPWLGDLLSFLYDRIMEKSIFPKKFNGSIIKHFQILKIEFENIHNMNILEFATGSGNSLEFLNNDNIYTGIDISTGLLHIVGMDNAWYWNYILSNRSNYRGKDRTTFNESSKISIKNST